MSATLSRRLTCAIVTSLSLAAAMQAGAQGSRRLFEPGEWGGSVEANYEGDRQRSQSAGDGGSKSSFRRIQETVNVSNSGFSLIDPSLLNGDISLSFGRFNDTANADGSQTSGHGALTGYGFDTVILGASPYSTFLHANRVQSFQARSFGRTESLLEAQGAEFRLSEGSILTKWGVPYFSSTLRAEREHVHQNTINVIGSSFEMDEVRRRLAYDGHKGFERADLNLNYSVDENSNSNYPGSDSRGSRAAVSYGFDFGPTYNWRSETGATYFKRYALFDYESKSVQQHLHIDHRSNLATDYSYLGSRTEAPTGVTILQNAAASLTHTLYQNLTTSARLTGEREKLPSGSFEGEAGNLQFGYRHGLPHDGNLQVQLGAGVQQRGNHLMSSVIDVTGEGHQAPATLGTGASFALEQPFVSPSSIVVRDVRGGGVCNSSTSVGTLLTSPGDYTVEIIGGVAHITPSATSAVIQPGDLLCVNYAYQVDPSIRYRTRNSSVAVGAGFSWITVSLSHEESTQTLLSGQERGFLDESHSTSASVDLRGQWRTVQLQGGSGYKRFDSTQLTYDQWRLYQTAQYRPRNNVSVGLAANYTHTDYTLLSRKSDTTSFSLTGNYFSTTGWTTTAALGHRVFSETGQASETIDEGNIDERFEFGKFSLFGTVAAARQRRDGVNTFGWRFQISAIRSF